MFKNMKKNLVNTLFFPYLQGFMEKLLTGIGPVKYNGFMRFPGSVLHIVLHISEDGIIFIEASV